MSNLIGAISGITEVWIYASASGGGGGSGTVTSVSAGGGLDASTNPIIGAGDIFIATTGVSAGRYTYPTLDINARGQVTSAANGSPTGGVTSVSAGGGLSASVNPIISTGDIFIANTAVSAGNYTLANITVNSRGQITAASNGAAGSGTVTSAGFTGSQGVSIAGSPITTQGVVNIGLGDITPTNITTSAGTFTGKITGVAAAFSGLVSADAGIKATIISAASVNLTGDLVADRITASAATISNRLTAGTAAFAGKVSADAGLNTTTVSAASIGVTGDINASTGRVIASAATLTGKLTAATAVFSGLVSADAGIKTTTVSADSIGITGDINAGAGRVIASAATVTGKITGATAVFSGIVSADAGIATNQLNNQTTNGFVKTTSNNGTISIDTNTYLTSNQTITLTGDLTGSGTTTISATISAGAVGNSKLAQMPNLTIHSNITGASASPSNNTGSAILDAAFSSAQGSILYRGAAAWAALTPGTSGQFLQTQGVSANPQWAAAAGGGTVTSVSAGAGLTASSNPITTTGDLRLDTSAENAWTAEQYFSIATLTDASAINWNLKSQQTAQVTIAGTGTRQFQDPTNMRNGATYLLKVTKSSAQSCTLAWTSAYRWPGGTAPTFSTASGATDIFTFFCVGSAMYGSYTQNYTAG